MNENDQITLLTFRWYSGHVVIFSIKEVFIFAPNSNVTALVCDPHSKHLTQLACVKAPIHLKSSRKLTNISYPGNIPIFFALQGKTKSKLQLLIVGDIFPPFHCFSIRDSHQHSMNTVQSPIQQLNMHSFSLIKYVFLPLIRNYQF